MANSTDLIDIRKASSNIFLLVNQLRIQFVK